jgi:hypothetical protein
MKKNITLSIFSLLIIHLLHAQNVGIKTTTPQSALDINGDLTLRKGTLTLPTGGSNNVDISTNKFSVYDFAGGALTGGAQIYGFTGGTDGRIITIFNNSTIAAMQIADESHPGSASSLAPNRIVTGSGNNAVIYQNGSATLRYDGQKQRWTIIGSSYTDGLSATSGSAGVWSTSGANIYNNNTGNVGIGAGIIDPLFKMDIGDRIRIRSGVGSSSAGVWLNNLTNTEPIAFMGIADNSTTGLYGNNSGWGLTMNTNTGNVGIGGTATDFKLAINSNVVQSNTNTHVLSLKGRNPVLSFFNEDNTNYGYLKMWNYAPYAPFTNGLVIGASPGYPIFFSTNNYGATMTIADNGNVGIGTTLPTHKLSVNGTIRSREVIVENINWADYVFDEQYKLKPLLEVEAFIKANKHLPNIPSAKEIEKNGLSVGETQKKMMEKIEELTLYLIESNKQIESLKKQVDDLQKIK